MALVIGVLAGYASGLVGVGGGIVMVPLLLAVLHVSQHEAHATSLAAIVVIAAFGAAVFASAGEVEMDAALALTIGAVAGAPLGARIMAESDEGPLRIAFGVIMIATGIVMVVT